MFWPNAIAIRTDKGKPFSLFTQDSAFTIEEAKEIIEEWKSMQDIEILCAFIKDETENKIVYLENNVDAFGNVNYNKTSAEEKNISGIKK